MSRGFWSLLAGLAITVISQFVPWPPLIWPARVLLQFVHPPRSGKGQAVLLVILIAVNTAGWAALIAGAWTLLRLRHSFFSRRAG